MTFRSSHTRLWIISVGVDPCSSIVVFDTYCPAPNDGTMLHFLQQYGKVNGIFQRDTIRGHSVQFLLLRQAVGKPLRTGFPVLHMLGQDGVSGAVTNSQHRPNVFHRPSLVTSDDSILRNNDRR